KTAPGSVTFTSCHTPSRFGSSGVIVWPPSLATQRTVVPGVISTFDGLNRVPLTWISTTPLRGPVPSSSDEHATPNAPASSRTAPLSRLPLMSRSDAEIHVRAHAPRGRRAPPRSPSQDPAEPMRGHVAGAPAPTTRMERRPLVPRRPRGRGPGSKPAVLKLLLRDLPFTKTRIRSHGCVPPRRHPRRDSGFP